MIQIGENPIKLAEREGFEPSVPVTQYARLATENLPGYRCSKVLETPISRRFSRSTATIGRPQKPVAPESNATKEPQSINKKPPLLRESDGPCAAQICVSGFDRDHLRRLGCGRGFARVKRRELRCRFLQIGLGYNRVPAINALSLMPGHFHRL